MNLSVLELINRSLPWLLLSLLLLFSFSQQDYGLLAIIVLILNNLLLTLLGSLLRPALGQQPSHSPFQVYKYYQWEFFFAIVLHYCNLGIVDNKKMT